MNMMAGELASQRGHEMGIHDWTIVDDGIFHAMHVNWTVELARALNGGTLPEGYYALPEQIAWDIHPDVLTLHSPIRTPPSTTEPSDEGGVALLQRPRTSQEMTIREPSYVNLARRISIRHVSGDDVVAFIELVSRSNKSTIEALGMLVSKTCNALRLGIHVLLVDLYPPGPKDPRGLHALIWESLGGELPAQSATSSLAAVSYEAAPPSTEPPQLRAYIEPLSVGESLPPMPLFLDRGQHVLTPLEETYQLAFDALPARWRTVLESHV